VEKGKMKEFFVLGRWSMIVCQFHFSEALQKDQSLLEVFKIFLNVLVKDFIMKMSFLHKSTFFGHKNLGKIRAYVQCYFERNEGFTKEFYLVFTIYTVKRLTSLFFRWLVGKITTEWQ
jgi:hypothetical protein